MTRIKVTSKLAPSVDPKLVAEALGAEAVPLSSLPGPMQRAFLRLHHLLGLARIRIRCAVDVHQWCYTEALGTPRTSKTGRACLYCPVRERWVRDEASGLVYWERFEDGTSKATSGPGNKDGNQTSGL